MTDNPESPLSEDRPSQDTDSTSPVDSAEAPVPVAAPGSVTAPTPIAQPSSPAAQDTPAQSAPKGSRSRLVVTLLLVVILIIAAGAIYMLRPATKPAPLVKKDIPLINYGLSDGTLSQTYPLGNASTSIMVQVNSQLFEGLVRYQQETKIVPLLATNWSNPNDTTWVFNLQRGVKFHNGRSLTAQDVKYSLDYAVAHQNDPNATAALAEASTIKSVEAVNTFQVKIVTNGPDPTLLNRLAALYVFDSKAKLGDPNAGTGPYIVKPGTKPSATSINLVASNNYWGGHVYTRALHIAAVTNKDKLGADVAKGQFDLAGDLSDSELAKIKSQRVINVNDTGVSFLGLNTLKPSSPLASLAGRQAAAYALNIPAILKAGGLRGQQASQLIPLTILGHDPSIHNTPYDPAKAKTLLASVKEAATPLTLSYPTGDGGQVQEIAKELNAVGFNVQLAQPADVSTLVDTAFSGQTDLFYLSYSSDILDGLDIISSLVQGNQDYTNPQIDSLADQASSTLDPATRIQLLQKISRIVAQTIPDIPLYTQTRSYVLTKPYHIQVDIPATETGAYFWQVYQQ